MDQLLRRRAQATAAINQVAEKSPTPKARFEEGDQVWLEATHLKLPYHTPKLAPKCQGPFKIIQVVSPLAYRLDLPTSWNIHDVFHSSLLLPFKETAAHGPNYSCPPPDLIKDQPEYKVEKIINHCYHGRTRTLQYLIKWVSYPSADNTWENATDVHVDDLIALYHKFTPLEQHKRARRQRRMAANWSSYSSPLETSTISQTLGLNTISTHSSPSSNLTCRTPPPPSPSSPRDPTTSPTSITL
jgi:hypothetical protein